MPGSKARPLMLLRLSGDDREWVREQARWLEEVTGIYSESVVIHLVIRRFRKGIADGAIDWDVGRDYRASDEGS